VWGGIKTSTDEGSFLVSLDGKEPKITDIKNNLETMKDDCSNILLNPTTCTGLLHVAGAKEIKVTPANPPGQPYRVVEIWFVPYPVEISWVYFNCPPPPGHKTRSEGNERALAQGQGIKQKFGRAFPFYLKFDAKDEEQIITDSSDDEGSLKVWVRKAKDD
ncbi:MAG: hypothetical protein ABIW34_05850, partial [Ginsengibacter sp.]